MNYKKIYSQAIKTLLKDQPLPMHIGEDAEIKVNPKAEISPFYIYENGELAGIIAPIRQKK